MAATSKLGELRPRLLGPVRLADSTLLSTGNPPPPPASRCWPTQRGLPRFPARSTAINASQMLTGMVINLVIGLLCYVGFVLWRGKWVLCRRLGAAGACRCLPPAALPLHARCPASGLHAKPRPAAAADGCRLHV